MKQFKTIFFAMFAFVFVLASCTNDDDVTPEPDNEEEVITTVKLKFTEGSNSKEYSYKIMDNTPTVETIVLDANKTYLVEASFYNELETPAENITEEIEEEDHEHLICYTESMSNLVAISYNDVDENNIPVGLETTWVTNSAKQGSVALNLRHQPDLKADAGEANCNLGETDIEAVFPITIQ